MLSINFSSQLHQNTVSFPSSSSSSIIDHLKPPKNFHGRCGRHFFDHVSARSHPPGHCFTASDQFLSSFSFSATSYNSTIDISSSVKFRRGPRRDITKNILNWESSRKTTSTESQFTTAPKQHIEINQKEAIRRRNESFIKGRFELYYKTKSSQKFVILSSNSCLQNFFKNGKCYNACWS